MSTNIYTHKHHIIPKHAGGTDDPSNIIELTIEEHALAHKKLFFIYGRWQDEIAYLTLSGQIGKEEAKIRAIREGAKKRRGIPRSEESKRKQSGTLKGRTAWNKGKKHTEEAKRKMKGRIPWNKGKTGIYSEETILKISEAQKGRIPPMTGKKHTEESKRKMSESKKGIQVAWNKGKKGIKKRTI